MLIVLQRTYATLAPLLLVCAVPLGLFAQTAVRGRVLNPAGEAVAAATVTLASMSNASFFRVTASDSLGDFAFDDVQRGTFVLRAERIGYVAQQRTINVTDAAVTIELRLLEAPVSIAGVTVAGQRARARFEGQAGVTSRELSKGELKLMPGFAESDVLRAIEALPGVVSTSDFSAAYNVRGGSADQNLILLDGIPLYNPFHLGGTFSVFNSDMVERAELLAGGFPAEYGGRVSSVLNVVSDVGRGGFDVRGGVSVLASRVAVSGALPQASAERLGISSAQLRVGARRSYFDQLLKPFFEFPYHLTDVQLASEVWIDSNSRLSASAYIGDDVLNFAGVDSFPLRADWQWGNGVAGVAWTKTLAGGGALDVRSSYSRFSTEILFPDFGDTRFTSRIEHVLLRGGVALPADHKEIKLGGELNHLWYANRVEAGGTVFRQGREAGWQPSLYAQVAWRPRAEWLVETGLRGDAWLMAGVPAVAKLSPRLAVKRFIADGNAAFKLTLGRYTQFVHSVREEELPIGIDVWVITGPRAPHVVSDQAQTGFEWYPTTGWYAAVEAFYRKFDGVTANNYADDPNDFADDLLAGTGLSYGGDMVVRKDEGKLRGFLTLSWLKTWREFPDFLSGLPDPPPIRYPPIFDRRFEMDFVLRFDLPRGWESGLRFNFGSGLPYTRAVGGYQFYEYRIGDGRKMIEEFGDSAATAVLLEERNASRYPAYHRLDISLRKDFGKRWGKLTPHLDILNVYNRRNVLFYFFDYRSLPATRSGVSMFPFLPTLGVEVVF